MKKIIIQMKTKLLIIIIGIAGALAPHGTINSQSIDTTNWSLTANQIDGKYDKLINRNTYEGKAAGNVIIPLSLDIIAIDTSSWSFVKSNVDGTYRQATNRITFYGKAAGTVVINLIYNTTSSNFFHYANIDSVNSFSVQQKLLNDTVSVDAGGTNAASVTINKQTGVITVTNQRTVNSDFILTVSNSLIAAGSVVIPNLETISDITGNSIILIPRIYSVTNGQFICKISTTGNFSGSFKIHFVVFNQ